mmetsp:Transcript_17859/g.42349  ORF Transcript_17859/g.42349 Transcript_17859/m.42349 type:complete len:265 (+) Transcript_17859:309-1103(+)
MDVPLLVRLLAHDELSLDRGVPLLERALLLLAEVLPAVDHGLDHHVRRRLRPQVLVVQHAGLTAVEDGVAPHRTLSLGQVLRRGLGLERGVDARQPLDGLAHRLGGLSELEAVVGEELDLREDAQLPHAQRQLALGREEVLLRDGGRVEPPHRHAHRHVAQPVRVLHARREHLEEGARVLLGDLLPLEQRVRHPRHLDKLGRRADVLREPRRSLDHLVTVRVHGRAGGHRLQLWPLRLALFELGLLLVLVGQLVQVCSTVERGR